MEITKVTNSIQMIGIEDKDIDLFEGQYVVPNGISYNSYVILDEKVVVMDTIDKRKQEEWFANLQKVLDGRKVDYLVISHLEPDHSASIQKLAEKYPDMKIIGNALTFKMFSNLYRFSFFYNNLFLAEINGAELW